mgnify:FL=1
MSIDAEKIYKLVMDGGMAWADCKAAFQLLDDLTKTILADQCTAIKIGYKCTQGEAETRALASEAYKAHLTSLAVARKAWLHAEVRYKSAQLLAELRRSEESTRRAEIGLR